MSEGPDVTAVVHRGMRLFNQGRYFTAQQLFEECWGATSGADRGFLEALVQLSAGLHLRTRRGATQGAEHLIVRALIALDEHQPARHGVDVTALIAEFDAFVRWLREVRRPHRLLDRLRVPRIRAVAP